MYKHLLVVLFFLSHIGCKEIRKEYYPTGELNIKYQVNSDNKLHGTLKVYYKSGVLKKNVFYKNGQKEGIKKAYFENGQLDYETEYENNKANGFHRDYSKEGALIAEGVFKNGKQHGVTRWYFPDGRIKKEAEFSNGISHGVFKSYYINEQLKFYAYSDSNRTTFYKSYTETGEKKEEYREISIEFEKDSIFIGEQCKATILIFGPKISNLKAEIQLADRILQAAPLDKKVNIKENSYVFTETVQDTGRKVLNIRFFVDEYRFFHTKELYVLHRPDS